MRFMPITIASLVIPLASSIAQPIPSQVEWSALSGDSARTGTRLTSVPSFTPRRWLLSQTLSGQAIKFTGPAGLVATVIPQPRLFGTAIIAGQTNAIAVNAETGLVAWTHPIPDLVFDSWSSPALDSESGTVIFACGATLLALRMSDGAELWRTDLDGPPVNVSPLITDDTPMRKRAFVTDYGGFGGPSSLYCINVSPRYPFINPFDPGDIIWAAPIGSSTGGTPAYLDGVVYVCSTGLDTDGYGEIQAFDARATTQPAPRWTFTNPIPEGFFGGLTIRETAAGLVVYAATYAFYGERDSANLVKVNARTGSLIWSIACNRTDSIPIVLADARIVLSTGIQGFGSIPTVQLFRDNGSSASLLWSTAESTWIDADHDGLIEVGEFLLVGGWTTHPVVTQARTPGATPRLLVGAIPIGDDFFGPYTELFEFDLSKNPSQSGFIVQRTSSAGSTPAMLGAGVYSVGTSGLAAFGPPPPRPDVNADGRLDTDDLLAWDSGLGFRDVDRSGAVNVADRDFLAFELRRNERRDMTNGRR